MKPLVKYTRAYEAEDALLNFMKYLIKWAAFIWTSGYKLLLCHTTINHACTPVGVLIRRRHRGRIVSLALSPQFNFHRYYFLDLLISLYHTVNSSRFSRWRCRVPAAAVQHVEPTFYPYLIFLAVNIIFQNTSNVSCNAYY